MEEITKPLTLAFRLFGNILAGEILLEVLYFLVPIGIPIIWLLFSLVIGLIQALSYDPDHVVSGSVFCRRLIVPDTV